MKDTRGTLDNFLGSNANQTRKKWSRRNQISKSRKRDYQEKNGQGELQTTKYRKRDYQEHPGDTRVQIQQAFKSGQRGEHNVWRMDC